MRSGRYWPYRPFPAQTSSPITASFDLRGAIPRYVEGDLVLRGPTLLKCVQLFILLVPEADLETPSALTAPCLKTGDLLTPW